MPCGACCAPRPRRRRCGGTVGSLGHATVAFTLDTYSADVPDLDREAARAISALFVRPTERDDDDENPPGTGQTAI
jgi:hypothetical protein